MKEWRKIKQNSVLCGFMALWIVHIREEQSCSGLKQLFLRKSLESVFLLHLQHPLVAFLDSSFFFFPSPFPSSTFELTNPEGPRQKANPKAKEAAIKTTKTTWSSSFSLIALSCVYAVQTLNTHFIFYFEFSRSFSFILNCNNISKIELAVHENT